jgi:myo-inositol-1(or 4)-monophosphatase
LDIIIIPPVGQSPESLFEQNDVFKITILIQSIPLKFTTYRIQSKQPRWSSGIPVKDRRFYLTSRGIPKNPTKKSKASRFKHDILPTMNKALDFASQLAQDTGHLLLDFYKTSGIQANLKPDHTVVTEADLAADCFIHDSIQAKFPEDGILSEEASTIYPEGKSHVWIIDPLDGTTNFSLGLHYWGVSIARLWEGNPEIAALFFPLLGELFMASKGGGATLNGARLHVKSPESSQPETFFSCCSRTHRQYKVDIRYKTRILGSAAYGLSSVARGSAILAFEVTPKVWDFSGSWLITQEAGGVIAPLNGGSPFPLVPGKDYGPIKYQLLAATTQANWDEGKRKIRKR